MDISDHASAARHVLDAGAAATAAATWFGYLPNIAALLSIIWLLIQIGGWIAKQIEKWREG